MPAIQEVAKRAGVSAGTVSRHLNGHQLKAANQSRVEAAIEELGYRSDYLVRSLRSKQSMSIGLLISNMLDHFAVSVVAQVEREVELNDYNIILSGFREGREALNGKVPRCDCLPWRILGIIEQCDNGPQGDAHASAQSRRLRHGRHAAQHQSQRLHRRVRTR